MHETFKITPAIVESVVEAANDDKESLDFTKNTLRMIRTRFGHSELYKYLQETSKQQSDYWYTYAVASAMSYAVINNALDQQRYNVCFRAIDVASHKQTAERIFSAPVWSDNFWVLSKALYITEQKGENEIEFFFNILAKVSPEYLDCISQNLLNLDDYGGGRHMIRGFFDGFMPFYTKLKLTKELS